MTDTDSDRTDIRDELKQYIDQNDKLIVTHVKGYSSTFRNEATSLISDTWN